MPAGYTLGVFSTQNPDPSSVTQLAIRTSNCAAITNPTDSGTDTRPTTYSQIGITDESPDGTGMANAYELAFLSDNPHQINFVKQDGVTHALVNNQSSFTGPDDNRQTSLDINAPYTSPLTGSVQSPAPSLFIESGFVANWWEDTTAGRVRLQNVLPTVVLGFCSGTIHFTPGSQLAQIAGTTSKSIDFCLHNSYDSATRKVTVQ